VSRCNITWAQELSKQRREVQPPLLAAKKVAHCRSSALRAYRRNHIPRPECSIVEMRLINTATLGLETFTSSTPPYAILSHTWQDDEVSMADMSAIHQSDDARFSKIRGMCAEASRIGLGYAWVDTCCIDKSSSAELSEAINSMFEWYRAADICFCLLSDFQSHSSLAQDLKKCRWFTRGWTLQELIAPDILVFFDSSIRD
jgi:hypothetical protein